MVSTYWAELPARLIGHPDANGRFIPSPAHPNLGVMAWAEAFLRVSADYLAIEVGQSGSI